MSPHVKLVLTAALFFGTLLGIFRRPGGWHEGWWTCGGATLALLTGLVRPSQVLGIFEAGKDALLFLFGLLLLSLLLDKSGFFGWAALACARASGGSAGRLFNNFLLLGAFVTVTLSLDTTAVLLTPLVLVCAQKAGLSARPFVVLCALVSNTASLLLPVSNLTNLLLVPVTQASFARFAAVQALPQAAVLAVLAVGLRVLYRRQHSQSFALSQLPEAGTAVRHPVFFRGSVVTLGLLLAGEFFASHVGVPVWCVAVLAGMALLGLSAALGVLQLAWLRELPLGIFPFVAGLFVLVGAVENLGLQSWAVAWLRQPHGTLSLIASATGASALLSNALNNLPAVLLLRSVLSQAASRPAVAYGVLLGANVGPCVGVYGSLATVLVLAEARRRGVQERGMDVARAGLLLTPAMLLMGGAALWLVLGPAG